MKQIQLNAILQGYARFFRSFLRVTVFTLVVTAAAALISFPLWYWATRNRAGFNLFVVFVLILAAGMFMLQNIRSKMRTSLSSGASILSAAVIEPLTRIGRFLLTVVLIFTVVYLFASSRFLLGLLGALLSLFIIGVFYFHGRAR